MNKEQIIKEIIDKTEKVLLPKSKSEERIMNLLIQLFRENLSDVLDEYVKSLLPEEKYLKNWFEANYLDGDKIQDGQTFSSGCCFEAILSVLQEIKQRANIDEKKDEKE